jgi:hypothetical protein
MLLQIPFYKYKHPAGRMDQNYVQEGDIIMCKNYVHGMERRVSVER